jgi:hypothetical protein
MDHCRIGEQTKKPEDHDPALVQMNPGGPVGPRPTAVKLPVSLESDRQCQVPLGERQVIIDRQLSCQMRPVVGLPMDRQNRSLVGEKEPEDLCPVCGVMNQDRV